MSEILFTISGRNHRLESDGRVIQHHADSIRRGPLGPHDTAKLIQISCDPRVAIVTEPGTAFALDERFAMWSKLLAPKSINYGMYAHALASKDGVKRVEWGMSFGWRQGRASLESFLPNVTENFPDQVAYYSAVKKALSVFERRLNASFSRAELYQQSQLMNHFPNAALRDDLRFFFNVAVALDSTIIVTIFLEPTFDEVALRPTNYASTNKHLHHAFLSSRGAIRKLKGAFKRDAAIAHETEATAYAQVYIRPLAKSSGGHGVSLLLHPLQRVRLGYNHHLDRQSLDYKKRITAIANRLIVLGAKLEHQEVGSVTAPKLARAGHLIKEILPKVMARTFCEECAAALAELDQIPRMIPESIAITKDPPAEFTVRDTIRRVVRHMRQLNRMAIKQLDGHEANYTIADKITGPRRELLFIAVSDILRDSFRQVGDLEAYRYMLSPSQIDGIPLTVRAKDTDVREKLEASIRARVRSVADEVAKYSKCGKHLYYLEKPDEKGQFHEEYREELWGTEGVELLSLDEGG